MIDNCAWCDRPIKGTAPYACSENEPYSGQGICSDGCFTKLARYERLRASATEARRAETRSGSVADEGAAHEVGDA